MGPGGHGRNERSFAQYSRRARHLCIVNGKDDSLFPVAEVDRAVDRLKQLYPIADAADRPAHHYGPAGRRFYADLMWPFIDNARPSDR
jgi:hypothetical protein